MIYAILALVSFLLCLLIKTIWKAFLAGLIGYILISFLLLLGKSDAIINTESMEYFVFGLAAKFVIPFAAGATIWYFLIKKRKIDSQR
jgi:peptidoglycan/LPS O-acetylase OafA/YrhL